MTTATTELLHTLIKIGTEHAERILLKERQRGLMPFYHLVTEQNEHLLVPVKFNNDDEKEVAVAVVKATAVISKAIAMLYVAEAWMLNIKPAATDVATPWHIKRLMENLPRPSQSPDRIEAVQCIATDGRTTINHVMQMVRDKPGGRIIALVPVPEMGGIDTGDGPIKYSGRMISGIIPPPKE